MRFVFGRNIIWQKHIKHLSEENMSISKQTLGFQVYTYVILTVWDIHQKVWRLNIHCDNSLEVDMAE